MARVGLRQFSVGAPDMGRLVNDELVVEWFNPDLFPNAPAEKRGAWVKLYGGTSVLDAQQAFLGAGQEGKVVRLTWRPR